MKYNVHLFTTVRVKVPNVEADTMKDAVRIAEAIPDFGALFDGIAPFETAFAEDITEALVDVVGADNFTESKWFEYMTNGWKETSEKK